MVLIDSCCQFLVSYVCVVNVVVRYVVCVCVLLVSVVLVVVRGGCCGCARACVYVFSRVHSCACIRL